MPRGPFDVFCNLALNKPSLKWRYTSDKLAEDFSTLFSASPLTQLNLYAHSYEDGERVSRTALIRLFGAFPMISTLQYDYESDSSHADDLFGALSYLASSAEEDTRGAQTKPRGIILPDLGVLWITDLRWGKNVLSALLECLRSRQEHRGRLQELHVELYGRERGDHEANEEHARLIRALEVVSETVTYIDSDVSEALTGYT